MGAGLGVVRLLAGIRTRLFPRRSVIRLVIVTYPVLCVVGWLSGGSFAAGVFFPRSLTASSPRGVAVAAGAAAGLTVVFAFIAVTAGAAYLFARLRVALLRAGYADVVIVYQLARVIVWLAGDVQDFRDLARRREAVDHLAIVADLVEHGLPRRLAVRSLPGNLVLRQRLQRSAQQFREFQLWVMTPHGGTRTDLRAVCCTALGSVAFGEYDLLPADPVAQHDRPSRWRIALTKAWLLIVGLLPLGVVLALQWKSVALPKPLDGAALVVAALWAFVSILLLVDPLFGPRLNALKDLSQAMKTTTGSPAKTP